MSEAIRISRKCGASPEILAVTPREMEQMLQWAVESEEYELAAAVRNRMQEWLDKLDNEGKLLFKELQNKT